MEKVITLMATLIVQSVSFLIDKGSERLPKSGRTNLFLRSLQRQFTFNCSNVHLPPFPSFSEDRTHSWFLEHGVSTDGGRYARPEFEGDTLWWSYIVQEPKAAESKLSQAVVSWGAPELVTSWPFFLSPFSPTSQSPPQPDFMSPWTTKKLDKKSTVWSHYFQVGFLF